MLERAAANTGAGRGSWAWREDVPDAKAKNSKGGRRPLRGRADAERLWLGSNGGYTEVKEPERYMF